MQRTRGRPEGTEDESLDGSETVVSPSKKPWLGPSLAKLLKHVLGLGSQEIVYT